MKKIILAVASVLALGLLASCKQTVDGSLTVTNYTKSLDQSTSKTILYTLSGSVTTKSTQKTVTKASGASETSSAFYTYETTYNLDPDKTRVEVSYTEDPNNNKVDYTFTFVTSALKGKSKTIYKATSDGTSNTSYSDSTYTPSLTLRKVDGKYYWKRGNDDVWVLIEDAAFSVGANEIDLSKFVTPAYETTTYTADPTYDSDGAVSTFSKTVKNYDAVVSTLKLTKK